MSVRSLLVSANFWNVIPLLWQYLKSIGVYQIDQCYKLLTVMSILCGVAKFPESCGAYIRYSISISPQGFKNLKIKIKHWRSKMENSLSILLSYWPQNAITWLKWDLRKSPFPFTGVLSMETDRRNQEIWKIVKLNCKDIFEANFKSHSLMFFS